MLTHGGDIVGFARRYGVAPLDFSVNTNPFGLSPNAKRALLDAGERAGEYPDPLYRKLRAAIAAHEDVPMEWVACGNGAADLIWRVVLAQRPKKALVTAPTFSEYETALNFVNCHVEHHFLTAETGFRVGEDILENITQETGMMFLCNPNNPTGLTVEPALLERVLKRCRACGTLLVVDECFLGFLPEGERLTVRPQLGECSNLLILKAFTKLYGMAGLRLGYCLCSDTELLAQMGSAGQCWPVSIAAEEAGIAALQDGGYVEKTLVFLPPERERVRRALEQLGLRVWPGEANYLFFYTDIPNFHQRLAEQGILIRSCSNYVGLGDGYYRAAILLPEENDRLLAAVERIGRETV